jgi:group II intron reverse transcriptase/maturase
MTTELARIAEMAKARPKLCFTSLAHLITPEFLMETWKVMNRRGAPGVDGETTLEFAANLQARCEGLVKKLKDRSYRPPPVRRVEIPKGDGKTRPLGIPTVEDRLLQRAVARLMEAIYEADFLNCSYGFRPERGAHDALRTVRNQCMAGMVTTVFETDIRGFFNHLNHQWLMKMLRLRIGDGVILRLIGKWLKAGVLVNGVVVRSEEGSPQGGPISPLLANIYLHYALDLWFAGVVATKCKGRAYLVRYADDFVAGFQRESEAVQFRGTVTDRLAKFNLELAENKTRLLRFGRLPFLKSEDTGSFDFLGFQHVCGRDRQGRFAVIRLPARKSCNKFLGNVKARLMLIRYTRGYDQQRVLSQMLNGFFRYFGLPAAKERLSLVRLYVTQAWRKAIRSQGQRSKYAWYILKRKPWFKLPSPRVYHPNV